MLKKKMTKVLTGVLALSMLSGCGSASKMAMESAYDTAASNYSAAGGVYYDSGDYEYADEVSEENGSSQAETVEKGETTGRKLIRNVDMDVETESFDALLASAQSQAEELGGYIESSSISNSSYASSTSAARSARLTARIPSEKLDGYLAGISKQSNVTRKSESTEDVTLQYVDLQSHKKALLAEQESLLSMMEQAESIEDIIAINEQLTDVRYQIESMESQLRTYDNQVDYSTVNLYIDEVERYTPGAAKSAGARIAEGFSANIYRVGSFFKNFAIEFIILLPILIAIAIVLGIAILIVRIIIKISEKNQAGKKTSAKTEIRTGDRYRQKPGKEQIHGAEQTEKSGLCNAGRTPERGQVHTDESSDRKIAITSNKPQTTRNRIQTVYTGPKGQIVFLDTPGIHKAKNKLGNYMVKVAESTFSDVDVILWLVEPTTYIGAGERHILEQLKRSRLPVILVINKIDTVPKTAVLDAMETYRKEMDFAEIVPVSALRSNNTDTLLDCIFKYLPYGEPFYDEDTITDQPQRQIVAEMIREKALRCLEEEIPHGIAVAVERMEFKEHIVNIDATIICERDSHKGIIIGKQGSMLKKIGSQARRDIEDMLECQVNLQLWVKVKKDWRDSDFLLKNFGYNPADTRPDR